jgi:hypothetical protein
MTYPTRRWLVAFVVGVLWRGDGAHAQGLWRPVGQPVYAARGHVHGINPGEAVRHTAELRAGMPVHAWLEWDDPAIDLKLAVWRWQDERPQRSQASTTGPSMRVGQKIAVVEDNGKPVRARVVEIRPDRIIILQNKRTREIPVTRIVRIERGDSLRNGALIGFASGAGFALDRLEGCEMNCYGAFVPVLGAIGAGVGTLVDALRRTTTLYVIPERDLDAGAR